MDMYATEEQQVEQLKKLWDRFGGLVLYVLIGLSVCVMGVTYWQRHVQTQQEQASLYYQSMLQAHQQDDDVGELASANSLIKQYPASVYAQFAWLSLADHAVRSKDFAKAHTALTTVIEQAKEPSLVALAKLRLARVLVMQDKGKEALVALTGLETGYLSPLAYELRGDILTLQHQDALAKKAYQSALAALDSNPSHSALVKLKLENLG